MWRSGEVIAVVGVRITTGAIQQPRTFGTSSQMLMMSEKHCFPTELAHLEGKEAENTGLD